MATSFPSRGRTPEWLQGVQNKISPSNVTKLSPRRRMLVQPAQGPTVSSPLGVPLWG